MIKTITGPVKSGKSKKLIETYEELMSQNCKAQIFSSKFSLTSGESVVSRYGTSIKAIPIDSMFDIIHHLHPGTTSILIDEFQFLQMKPEELIKFLNSYCYYHNFYLFGLNLDYKKRPFELMALAMAYADENERIGGHCDICSNTFSKYSLRLKDNRPANIKDNDEIIILDGRIGNSIIKYQSVCEECWKEIYCKVKNKEN